MIQASVHSSLNGSRLVRFLNDLQVADIAVSHQAFSERLGQLIDLSDSITLSAAHGKLAKTVFEPAAISGEEIRDEFLRVRKSVVQSVVRGFVPNGGFSKTRLPAAPANTPADTPGAAEAYLKFYAAHQREISFRIHKLRVYVRETAAGLSPQLAQLCTLDSALGDALSDHARKAFAAIPALVAKRFDKLVQDYRQTPSGQQNDQEAWLSTIEQFCNEMQGLLLAEIEARLLPVVGLIEALNEDTDKIL